MQQISKVTYVCLGLNSVLETSVTSCDMGSGMRSLSFFAFVKKEYRIETPLEIIVTSSP